MHAAWHVSYLDRYIYAHTHTRADADDGDDDSRIGQYVKTVRTGLYDCGGEMHNGPDLQSSPTMLRVSTTASRDPHAARIKRASARSLLIISGFFSPLLKQSMG